MKYIFTLLSILVSCTSFAQVATYNFSGTPGNQASQPAASSAANVTASAITRGSGLTAMTGANSLNSNNWNSASQDANDYYEFTLTPSASYSLAISSLTINLQRSGAGPPNYLVSYTIGTGTETTITSGLLSTSANTALNPSITINTGQPVRFRIYAWGGTSALGTLRLNNTLSVNGSAPLPVKLISFTSQPNDKAITLHWTTASEDQNEGFQILKGQSPTGLEAIGFVAGHLTTQTLSTYSFTDSLVQPGTVYYYRLLQKDLDGTTQLSKIIDIRAGSATPNSACIVYPNPNQGQFYVAAQRISLTSLKLYDAVGCDIPIDVQSTDIANTYFIRTRIPLPTGRYYLQLLADNSQQQTLNIIIQ